MTRRYSRRATNTAAILGSLIAALAGCEADLHETTGPRVPIPNVEGTVLRAAAAAPYVDVELRTVPGSAVIDSASTDAAGRFSFVEVLPGEWEIKASGNDATDFDSITRLFGLAPESTRVILPAMDIHAYGSTPLEPAADARVPRPNLFAPLRFRWLLPERPVSWARVQVYDGVGRPVWSSLKVPADSMLWNGLGSEGEYAGLLVPAGSYTWRVKFELPDSVEARLVYRSLVLE